MNEYDETEIDIVDLIYQVLIKNIKKIIIVAIVCGLIGFSYAYIKSSGEKKVANALFEDSEAALEEYGSDDLDESKLLDISIYENNKVAYDHKVDYLSNSIKLNLNNCSNLYQYVALFRAINVKDIDGVVALIKSKVLDDDYLNSVYDDLGIKNNSEYYSKAYLLRELINIYNSNSNSVVISGEDNKAIYVSFIYDDAQIAEKIGNELANRISNLNDLVYESTGTSLKFVSGSVTSQNYSSIDTDKQNLQKEISTLASTIEDNYDDFNNIQLRYYSLLHPEEEVKVNSGFMKYTVIGAVIGAFLICCYYGVCYLLGNKIHTVDDLTTMGLDVYGLVANFKDHIFNNKKAISIDTLKELINLDLNKNGIKKVIMASSLPLDEIKNICDELGEDINIEGIYGDCLNNNDFIQLCKQDISVIYVEKLNISKLNDVKLEKDYNNSYKVNCLGYILVSE